MIGKRSKRGIWSVISEFPYLLGLWSYGAVSAIVRSLARLMHNYLCPEFALSLVSVDTKYPQLATTNVIALIIIITILYGPRPAPKITKSA
jgi:hypothetical protein